MANQLDMAEQQILGWHAAMNGERIESLVDGMGLTMKEWVELLSTGRVDYLRDYVKNEITNHLTQKYLQM